MLRFGSESNGVRAGCRGPEEPAWLPEPVGARDAVAAEGVTHHGTFLGRQRHRGSESLGAVIHGQPQQRLKQIVLANRRFRVGVSLNAGHEGSWIDAGPVSRKSEQGSGFVITDPADDLVDAMLKELFRRVGRRFFLRIAVQPDHHEPHDLHSHRTPTREIIRSSEGSLKKRGCPVAIIEGRVRGETAEAVESALDLQRIVATFDDGEHDVDHFRETGDWDDFARDARRPRSSVLGPVATSS